MTDDFVTRKWSTTTTSITSNMEVTIPKNCPICGVANSPTMIGCDIVDYYNNEKLQTISWKCTNCFNKYVTGHTRKDINDKKLHYLYIYPSPTPRDFSELIKNLSPRFVEIYKEGYYSESAGFLTSAGIAYRLALEILIKDYAIAELHKNEDEVTRKKLYAAIEDYLPNVDFQRVADVIRLKGNDYTHFKEKYDQVDFTMFKDYLNIFIDLIEVQLKINHPPIGHRE
ncbi:DUF4145 domain-containing protein [Enterococcus diestrammenae]|uniref:DUF4145 domain-containing protein n=1 Tax=Enterococcus diestrammenae TaxID=1155073 RepID=UPI00195A419B